YYGEWLPNTYYLKVTGGVDLFEQGVAFAKLFGQVYVVPVAIVLVAARARAEKPYVALVAGTVVYAGYCLRVGGDLFAHSRM
ncbi:hypothetical protein ABTK05_21630, partial [Acinetobacter baumannii]